MTRGKMFELASDAARTLMKKHGELRHPLFMFTTADGTFETVVVESDWMATDGAKDALCALMMMTMRAKRADSYAYVSEIWITSFNMGKPTDPVVDIAEVVREGNRKYHEEYERHGWNPSVGGGRDDAVLVVVGDAQGSDEQRLWTIARFPGKRKNGVQRVRDLIPKEREAEGAWGEGRFRDLLVDFAARKRQAH